MSEERFGKKMVVYLYEGELALLQALLGTSTQESTLEAIEHSHKEWCKEWLTDAQAALATNTEMMEQGMKLFGYFNGLLGGVNLWEFDRAKGDWGE